jgi:hypothetical protein
LWQSPFFGWFRIEDYNRQPWRHSWWNTKNYFNFVSNKLDTKKIPADGMVKVSFTVKNSGDHEGDEVAQVRFRHIHSSVPQPKLTLCGFARVHLNRGETGRVTVEVPAERLRYWDTEKTNTWLNRGNMSLSSARLRMISASNTRNIRNTKNCCLNSPPIPSR